MFLEKFTHFRVWFVIISNLIMVQLQNEHCLIHNTCGKEACLEILRSEGPADHGLKNYFESLRCHQCGFVFTNQVLGEISFEQGIEPVFRDHQQ